MGGVIDHRAPVDGAAHRGAVDHGGADRGVAGRDVPCHGAVDDGAVNYDGRVFRSSAAETAGPTGVPIGRYHQRGDLVWAEFAGGKVRVGRLVGTCAPDGTLSLTYCQVLATGEVLAGACTSFPELLDDGRIRLREEWRRFDEAGSTGVSVIEEFVEEFTQ